MVKHLARIRLPLSGSVLSTSPDEESMNVKKQERNSYSGFLCKALEWGTNTN